MKKILLICLLIIGLIGAMVVKSMMNFAAEEASRDAFKDSAAEYIDYEYEDSQAPNPYITGKVVTIDVQKRNADLWTFPKLPQELRASTPSEVGTVVLIEWEKKQVGHYEDRDTNEVAGDAYQAIGNVTLIDWSKKQIIDRKTFVGDKPVTSKSGNDDYMAWWPMFDVIKYLESLPKR